MALDPSVNIKKKHKILVQMDENTQPNYIFNEDTIYTNFLITGGAFYNFLVYPKPNIS